MAVLVSDLINGAFLDLTVIGNNAETLTAAMTADALLRINQDIDTLSAKGLVVPNQVEQTFNLISGITGYTLGAGGSWATTGGLRPLKVISWRAFYQTLFHSGGRALSLPEFGEQAQQAMGEATPIPRILGADTSYPTINVRVFPPSGLIAGQVELGYLTPVANFAAEGDTVTLPQGWQALLRTRLARGLWPQYPKPSLKDAIWDAADRAEAALIMEAAMSAPQPQPAAPQGQR